MNLFRLQLAPAATFALLAAFAGAAYGQTARSGGGNNAQLLQQMQQLASERTALQAENARMKKDLDDLRKERDALKKGEQAAEGRAKATEAALTLARNTSRRDTSEEELKQTKDRMQELVTKFRETIQTLKEVENESVTAKQAYAASDRDLKTCVDHNAALYKLNEEVLTRLEHQSGWSRVATLEPFTQIKRVQLENLVDDYKSRAVEQKLKAGSATPTGLGASATPAAPVAPAAPAAPAAQP
jgi:chromosome segregation ATPase